MTWWSGFFDYVVSIESSLPTLSLFKLERAFILVDLFSELLTLGF